MKNDGAMRNHESQAPYPFRTFWAILLLAINLLVAAYYFHIIE